ncbi:hypothetical protein JZO82_01470 [Vagococcus fluvialis]|uniref:hypothetical protein n=1 Tax=Vagococcus fluvialis TaxID=2738 RepID=UPI001A8EA2AC|nr:hypothetical protein [Vagococcus fluvialis]MBO0427819.1 hypothetical protein [Vagococcus fluvialis]
MSGLDLFSGLIGAVIGGQLTSQIQKMDSLDSKSGWRQKLFDLASKEKIDIGDVYLLRTTLRYTKNDKGCYEKYSFKYMSNQITSFCEEIIKNNITNDERLYSTKKTNSFQIKKSEDVFYKLHEYNEVVTIEESELFNKHEKEIVRIYARYLLKNHWEVYSSKVLFLNNNFKISTSAELGKKTEALVRREYRRMNMLDKNNDRLSDQEKKDIEREIDAKFESEVIFTKKGLTFPFWIMLAVTLSMLLLTIIVSQNMNFNISFKMNDEGGFFKAVFWDNYIYWCILLSGFFCSLTIYLYMNRNKEKKKIFLKSK